jgi:hypothetical protein
VLILRACFVNLWYTDIVRYNEARVLIYLLLLAGLVYWVELSHLMAVSNFLVIWNILVKRLVSDFYRARLC